MRRCLSPTLILQPRLALAGEALRRRRDRDLQPDPQARASTGAAVRRPSGGASRRGSRAACTSTPPAQGSTRTGTPTTSSCCKSRGRRPAPASPGRRPHRLADAGPSAETRAQPRRGSGLRRRRHVDQTPAEMTTDGCPRPDFPRRGRARSPRPDRPPPRRGLRHPEHPPGVLRGASAASTPSSTAGGLRTRPWPPNSPSSTTKGRAPASAAMAVAAACCRAGLAGEPSPAGGTDGPGPRRLPADRRPRPGAAVRGRGPGRRPRHLAAVLATWPPSSPPATGRGAAGRSAAAITVRSGR